MLVKTIREHANRFGDGRQKKVGDEYNHPDPQTLITTGFVIDVAKAKAQEAAQAKAAKGAKQPDA
ncbi:hypothetical protein [Blastomonas sp. CACIA14H2]|uniref:hypothetical protein n=1 Tax=Blastomonas sp. CACIA14H2 TaxID=1419876 RepID=UPI000423A403